MEAGLRRRRPGNIGRGTRAPRSGSVHDIFLETAGEESDASAEKDEEKD
jgi:hypothetical protein